MPSKQLPAASPLRCARVAGVGIAQQRAVAAGGARLVLRPGNGVVEGTCMRFVRVWLLGRTAAGVCDRRPAAVVTPVHA